MSLRGYAKHRGVTPPAVHKAIKTGRITRRPDGKIDADQADLEWAQRTDPAAPKNTVVRRPATVDIARATTAADEAPGGAIGAPRRPRDPDDDEGISPELYAEYRALREKYQAMSARLGYEQDLGQLIEVKIVKREAFRGGRAVRDRLMDVPAQLAPLLAAVTDEQECYKLLEDTMRSVCSEMARTKWTWEEPPPQNGRRK